MAPPRIDGSGDSGDDVRHALADEGVGGRGDEQRDDGGAERRGLDQRQRRRAEADRQRQVPDQTAVLLERSVDLEKLEPAPPAE